MYVSVCVCVLSCTRLAGKCKSGRIHTIVCVCVCVCLNNTLSAKERKSSKQEQHYIQCICVYICTSVLLLLHVYCTVCVFMSV